MKTFGFVKISPSDHAIVFKNGKIIKEGKGFRFFLTPSKQYVIIPAVVNSISFMADQITIENQGVEVSGFAIWKVSDPLKIYQNFDFSAEKYSLDQVNLYLKDVVESAIRHMVSNMTIDDVLRKRGTIILQLKKELEYISEEWGIHIETIEIKNVNILSSGLFDNMQAKYRNSIKLEAETSTLETEKEIEEQRLHFAEITLKNQHKSKQTELERKKEVEIQILADQVSIEKLKSKELIERKQQNLIDNLLLLKQEEENKRQTIDFQKETIEKEITLVELKTRLETSLKELQNQLKRMDIEVEKQNIDTLNTRNSLNLLYEKLPEIISSLDVKELNLGEKSLENIISKFKLNQ